MSERQLPPCWELQPYLAEDSVRFLLSEIADVLEQLYYHRHRLDTNWSEGVRAYDWVRSYLIQNEGAIPGLKMLSKNLGYVLALHKVPLQFSKDCINNPKKKHRLLRNRIEHEQLSLFGKSEPEQDITWRILAEPFISEIEEEDDDLTLPRWVVGLVGFNSYGVAVSKVLHHTTATIPLMSIDPSYLPTEAKIDDPDLRHRKKNDDLDVEDDGTTGDK